MWYNWTIFVIKPGVRRLLGAEIDLATQNVTQYMQWFANFTIANITARWEI